MKNIVCDLCKNIIKEEKNIWYVQLPFFQHKIVTISGKEVARLPGELSYKIIELCPNCAMNLANGFEKELERFKDEFGIEI